MAGVTLLALDHVVLTVRSIPKTIAFYTGNFGMRHEKFSAASSPNVLRHSLIFGTGKGQQKINLHEVGNEFLPRAETAKPGTADLCFITQVPISDVQDRLRRAGVQLETLARESGMDGGENTKERWQGFEDSKDQAEHAVNGAVVDRTGARGKLRSVYLRDPDGNLIEVSNYEPEIG